MYSLHSLFGEIYLSILQITGFLPVSRTKFRDTTLICANLFHLILGNSILSTPFIWLFSEIVKEQSQLWLYVGLILHIGKVKINVRIRRNNIYGLSLQLKVVQ